MADDPRVRHRVSMRLPPCGSTARSAHRQLPHPLDVQRQAHQMPLGSHLLHPTQAEASESQHLLEPAVRSLRYPLTLGVLSPSLRTGQLLAHAMRSRTPVRADRRSRLVGARHPRRRGTARRTPRQVPDPQARPAARTPDPVARVRVHVYRDAGLSHFRETPWRRGYCPEGIAGFRQGRTNVHGHSWISASFAALPPRGFGCRQANSKSQPCGVRCTPRHRGRRNPVTRNFACSLNKILHWIPHRLKNCLLRERFYGWISSNLIVTSQCTGRPQSSDNPFLFILRHHVPLFSVHQYVSHVPLSCMSRS